MPVPIIDNLILGTDLPLDARYVVDSYYDVSLYWYPGMQVFQTSDQQQYWYDGSTWIHNVDVSSFDASIAERMIWKNIYDPDVSVYSKNEVVLDGNWTMVANASTVERPAPQPIGNPVNFVTDSSWNTDSSIAVIYSGHDYEFLKTGWVRSIKAWVPILSSTTNYRFVIANVTDPSVPIVEVIAEPVLFENAWTTIALGNTIVTPGAKFRVYIDALDSGAETNVQGGWTYGGTANTAAPGSQSWNRRNQQDVVRIDNTDLDSVNRQSELLGVIPDSTILITETASPDNFFRYTVLGAPIDQTTYVQYSVLLESTGNGGPTIGSTTTINIDIPIAQETEYVVQPDYWVGYDSSFANITGYYAENGTEQDVSNNAYGIDIEFQEAYVSPYWDVVAVSSVAGAGVEEQIIQIQAEVGILQDDISTGANQLSILESSVAYLTNWNISQDASLERIDASIFRIDASLTNIDASLQLMSEYVKKSGDTMSGPLILDSSLRVLNKASFLEDVDIKGNLRVDGSTSYIHTDVLDVSTAWINLNTGFAGSPPIWLQSGIVIERGDASSYAFLYDESRNEFRVGIINTVDASDVYDDIDTQAVATREDIPVPGGIATWNETKYRFDTSTNLIVDGSMLIINSDVSINGKLDTKEFNVSGNGFPASPDDGDMFYYRPAHRAFWWDASRGKWLGNQVSYSCGKNSANRNTDTYMAVGSGSMTSLDGVLIPHNGVITGCSVSVDSLIAGLLGRTMQYRVNDDDLHSVDLTIPLAAAEAWSDFENLDVSAGDVIQAILLANGDDNVGNIIATFEITERP